jgi:uncharacterized protein (TIGR03067 family)
VNAVTLLALALGPAAPALKEKAVPEPTLVGEWAVESVTVGGAPARLGSDRWVFRADGTMSILSQGKVLDSRDYAVGEKARVRALDLTERAGRGQTDPAVYRIEGDTLTLSVGHQAGGRPADLEPGPKATVWVMKRVKDK